MLYRYLGMVKVKQKKAKEAIVYFEKAYKIALRQNLKQDLKDIYLGQTLAYSMERISFDRLTPSELTIPK